MGIPTSASAAGSPIFAAVGTGLSINTAAYENIAISWRENIGAAGTVSTRVLLQVGGQWYVSAQAFTPTVGANTALDTVGATLSLNYNPAASSWNSFNLTPSTATNGDVAISELQSGTMSIGATAVSDLSGTITGVGLFSQSSTTATIRIDQLNITATPIPEPANIAALLGLAGLGLTLIRKRRNAR
jgi:hypothetical protein